MDQLVLRPIQLYGGKALATQAKSRLIPLSEWKHFHVWPAPSGLRYFIANADKNGFDRVYRRVGRRLLIDEAAFFAWVDAQNGTSVERDE